MSDRLAFENIRHHDGWADLQNIVRVQRERRYGEITQVETAFYISSLANDAKVILQATRSH